MKLQVDTVIEGVQREGLAWGRGDGGEAVLIVVVGSRRVLVAMSHEDALECGIGACYVGQGLRMQAAQSAGAPAPQALLVDPQGVPLSGRGS